MPDRSWLELLRRYTITSHSYESNYLKRERIHLRKFDCYEAFKIGILASNLAKEAFPRTAVVIDISLPNGQCCFFRVITRPGSSLNDENWIKRNREIATTYGCSSYFMGLKFKDSLSQSDGTKYYLDSKEYAFFDGGALPIFIDSCEYPVACLSVSGLKQCENHWLAVEALKDYAREPNKI